MENYFTTLFEDAGYESSLSVAVINGFRHNKTIHFYGSSIKDIKNSWFRKYTSEKNHWKNMLPYIFLFSVFYLINNGIANFDQ